LKWPLLIVEFVTVTPEIIYEETGAAAGFDFGNNGCFFGLSFAPIGICY
jgi:hypothetical protein